MSEKLAKSDLRVLKPLGSPGQRAYGAITTELRNRLGEEFANLLAEPVASEFGNEIDWYSPISGTSKKLTELESDSRNEAYEKFLSLRNSILALADELVTSSSNEDMRLGEAFRHAICVPNEESCIYLVYSIDGTNFQPVLINWAHESDEPSTGSNTGLVINSQKNPHEGIKKKIPNEEMVSKSNEGETDTQETKTAKVKRTPTKNTETTRTITKSASTTKAATEISGVNVSKPRAILLLWILLAMLILVIIWLLLAPCGINIGSTFNHCPRYSNAQINAEYRRELLQNRKNLLERELMLLNNQCEPSQDSLQKIPQLKTDPETETDIQPAPDPDIIEIEQGKNSGSDATEIDQVNPTVDSNTVIIEPIDDIETIDSQNENKEDESNFALENENGMHAETDETNSIEKSSNEIVEADSTQKDTDDTVGLDETDSTEKNNDSTVDAGETNSTEENSDVTIETDETDGTGEVSENIIEHADLTDEINDPEVDEEFEERLSNRDATQGDLTISLLWHTKSDLDLILVCPSGDKISFLKKGTKVENCGGVLELDTNVYDSSLIDEPVEHIYLNSPQQGKYEVLVHMSRNRDSGVPVEFNLKIQHLGVEKTLNGRLIENDSTWVHEFEIEGNQ